MGLMDLTIFVVASSLTAIAVQEVDMMHFNTLVALTTVRLIHDPPVPASESVSFEFANMVCLTIQIVTELAHDKQRISTY